VKKEDKKPMKRPGALTAKGGMGYTAPIPSPQQMTLAEARERALMGRPEMAPMLPQEPTMQDVPGMTPEQIAPFNRPAPNLNDAVFGDVNPAEFIRRLLGVR